MADDGPIFSVKRISVGPEAPSQEPEILFEGPETKAIYHYQDEREQGSGPGRALVLIDADGTVVYACS